MSFVNVDVWLKRVLFLSDLIHNRNDEQKYELNIQSWSVQQEDDSTCFPNDIFWPSSHPPPSPLKASARLFRPSV